MEDKKGLVERIFWTERVDEPLNSDKEEEVYSRCKGLEKEGFGMLASEVDSSRMDSSESVVCPDDTILIPKQIINYWEKRRGSYSSKNLQDLKMHKARIYYMGFKGELQILF